MAKREKITLYIGQHIRKEWTRRGMGSVVPEFNAVTFASPSITVSRKACEEIAQDCAKQVMDFAATIPAGAVAEYKALYMTCQREIISFDVQDRMVPPWAAEDTDPVIGSGEILLHLNLPVYEEWGRRDMGRTVPEFNSVTLERRNIRVSRKVCEEIRRDCTNLILRAPADMTVRIKAGYNALWKQCTGELHRLDHQDLYQLPAAPWEQKTPAAATGA